MRFRKLALFISAVSAISTGLIVVACGTDNGTTPTPTPTVDGRASSSGSSGTSSGSSGEEGDTGVVDASTADCQAAPYLHAAPTGDAAFFCPFQDGGTACAQTDTCCDPSKPDGSVASDPFPPSFCAPGKAAGQAASDQACAAAAPAHGSVYQPAFFSLSFQCDDITGCASGESCVAITSSYADTGEHVNLGKTTSTKIPAACNAKQFYQLSGTQCITTPTTFTVDQKLICTKDADCSAIPGTTCVRRASAAVRSAAASLPDLSDTNLNAARARHRAWASFICELAS